MGFPPLPLSAAPLAVVGRGRVGVSLARSAELAGIEVRLAGRDETVEACRVAGAALLCVPDGSIAHGDRPTVDRHRAAIAETAPELLAAYDALAARAEIIAPESAEGVPA